MRLVVVTLGDYQFSDHLPIGRTLVSRQNGNIGNHTGSTGLVHCAWCRRGSEAYGIHVLLKAAQHFEDKASAVEGVRRRWNVRLLDTHKGQVDLSAGDALGQ